MFKDLVNKNIKNLRIIHIGSYWHGESDIVYRMLEALRKMCKVYEVDTKIYLNDKNSDWIERSVITSKKAPGNPLRIVNTEKIIEICKQFSPDIVFLNAGGHTLSDQALNFLRSRKIPIVYINLSDPDLYFIHGKYIFQKVDYLVTNSLYAARKLYPAPKKIIWSPFAVDADFFEPINDKEKFDVVVVGNARPERIKVVKELRKKFKVGLFGRGWGRISNDTEYVTGKKHVEAINSGKLYLSFSRTYAGYRNIKVGFFEAGSCRRCVLTDATAEHYYLFRPNLDFVPYTNVKDLVEIVRLLLKDIDLRQEIANRLHSKVINYHTWQHRWEFIIDKILANYDRYEQ